MPVIPRTTHRIQRHFAPLVARVRFPPERLLTPPPLPWHIVFDIAVEGIPNAPQDPFIEALPSDLELPNADASSGDTIQPTSESEELISKPAGEAGRKKNGYQLKAVLGWDDQAYLDVQVSLQRIKTNS